MAVDSQPKKGSQKNVLINISPQRTHAAKRIRNFFFSFTSPIEIFSSVLQPAGIPFLIPLRQ